jgi:hypothetical protein
MTTASVMAKSGVNAIVGGCAMRHSISIASSSGLCALIVGLGECCSDQSTIHERVSVYAHGGQLTSQSFARRSKERRPIPSTS